MNIVVLSRDAKLYSTKRLVEACGARGHVARVIDHVKCDIVIERKNPQILYKGRSVVDVDAVIPRIGASVTFYGKEIVRSVR